jgi:hypothetical protein
VPKLIDELLRSELKCLNQVVRERFRLATRKIIVTIRDSLTTSIGVLPDRVTFFS